MRFNKVKHVFVSSLHPDHFGGFPGFYLSSREASFGDTEPFKIAVYGPKGLRNVIQYARPFIGTLHHLDSYEYCMSS
jgi:ribonuclease BN (tRNA processing enzyme)